MRIIAQFSKKGAAKFISHLDLQRAVGRALRRTDIHIKYSEGFNPHVLLSFASALSVGIASEAEVMDVTLKTPEDSRSFCDKMNRVLPDGLEMIQAFSVEDNYYGLTGITTTAIYKVTLNLENLAETVDRSEIQARIDRMLSEPILVTKKSKSGMKEVDLRDFLNEISIDEITMLGEADMRVVLLLNCENSPKGSLNPNFLAPALTKALGASGQVDILRTALLSQTGAKVLELWALEPKGAALSNQSGEDKS